MKPYFRPGSTVLFQGDSVTDCGQREDPERLGCGYPVRIARIYNALFPNDRVCFTNRAISGDRVRDLLRRYDDDFKAVKPDFVSILIGINDVWRRYDRDDPCSVARFTEEYTRLLTQLKADLPDAQIMLITPFLLDSDPNKLPMHEDLDEKLPVVRRLAEEFGCVLFDYEAELTETVRRGDFPQEALSADGVHPTDLGQSLLAVKWLQKLGIL